MPCGCGSHVYILLLSSSLSLSHKHHLPLSMRPLSCCLIILFLQILALVTTSNGFTLFHQGTVQNQEPRKLQLSQTSTEKMEESRANKEMKEVGSSPPSCEHKCYGCRPCEATQVPTTTAHLRVQYSNYEPEGWMCKCGPTLFGP